MTRQTLIAGSLAAAGVLSLVVAVWHERLMHRHRLPGVTYLAATLRLDGGWRRADLFGEPGLRHQRRAARAGLIGGLLLLGALVAWVLLGWPPAPMGPS